MLQLRHLDLGGTSTGMALGRQMTSEQSALSDRDKAVCMTKAQPDCSKHRVIQSIPDSNMQVFGTGVGRDTALKAVDACRVLRIATLHSFRCNSLEIHLQHTEVFQ